MRWKASKAYGYVDVKLLSLSLKKQEKDATKPTFNFIFPLVVGN